MKTVQEQDLRPFSPLNQPSVSEKYLMDLDLSCYDKVEQVDIQKFSQQQN